MTTDVLRYLLTLEAMTTARSSITKNDSTQEKIDPSIIHFGPFALNFQSYASSIQTDEEVIGPGFITCLALQTLA